MGCSCSIDNDDGESVEVSTQSNPRARKDCQCSECYRVIVKGEKYWYTRYLFEGDWGTHRVCSDCKSVAKAMFCGGVSMGIMWEEIGYAFQENPELPNAECMMAMTKVGRDKVCDLLEKVWDGR